METLIKGAIDLVVNVGSIAAKAIAGAFKSPEELRQELVDAVDRFSAFLAPGGEMDQRRDAARKKTDDAIAAAEEVTKS